MLSEVMMFRFPPFPAAFAAVASLIALAGCSGSTGLADPSLTSELVSVQPAAIAGQCVTAISEVDAGTVHERWLRTVCPETRTPAFDMELRRALAARGFGGELETAISAYQGTRGLPTPVLAYRSAQQLGLVPWIDEAP